MDVVTHSQSKAKTQVAQTQIDTEFCVSPDPKHTLATMDEAQKEKFKNLFTEFITAVRGDIEKGTHTQHNKLDLMQAAFSKKLTAHRLNFDGNLVATALAWLHNFCRIAKLITGLRSYSFSTLFTGHCTRFVSHIS